MSADPVARELREHLHRVADLIADYVGGLRRRDVLPAVSPGEVTSRLPPAPPLEAEPMERILADYREIIEPNVTHWNHPGFLAYFSSTSSGAGVVAEALAAGLNVNAMLWRTGPAATELELLVCDWLRQMVGLPEVFRGHINDTASMGSFLALAAARHHRGGEEIRERGMAGRAELPRLTLYCSEQAHSSIDKAAIALGLGHANLRRVATDTELRLDAGALESAVAADLERGHRPIAVVATAGTTSTTSFDPIDAVAGICERHGLWLHVDAAHAGAVALSAGYRPLFRGWERADSIVINPHKWLFTPFDCSVLYTRGYEPLRAAFSVVPDYLRSDDGEVTNLMDLGIQLGRRFRALKLWMVIRSFGWRGLERAVVEHCRLARELAGRLERHPSFEIAAPVPLNTVCFRFTAAPAAELDALNRRLLEEVNAAGPVFLSHTVLAGDFVLRAAIGNPRTTEEDVERLWDLLTAAAGPLAR